MAKSVTTPQQNALAASHHVTALMIEVAFSSGTQRYTTAAASIAASAFDPGTLNLPWLGGVDPTWLDVVRETGGSEAVGLKITLNGVSSANRSLALQTHIQGRRFSMWLAVFDPATYVLVDAPVKFFEGLLDVAYPEDKDDGSTALVVEVESKMARLLRPAVRRYTDRDHQQRHPGDTICRFTSQVDKVVVWPSAAYFRQ